MSGCCPPDRVSVATCQMNMLACQGNLVKIGPSNCFEERAAYRKLQFRVAVSLLAESGCHFANWEVQPLIGPLSILAAVGHDRRLWAFSKVNLSAWRLRWTERHQPELENWTQIDALIWRPNSSAQWKPHILHRQFDQILMADRCENLYRSVWSDTPMPWMVISAMISSCNSSS